MNDPKETKPPMEDRWDYDHGPDHIREVMDDMLTSLEFDQRNRCRLHWRISSKVQPIEGVVRS